MNQQTQLEKALKIARINQGRTFAEVADILNVTAPTLRARIKHPEAAKVADIALIIKTHYPRDTAAQQAVLSGIIAAALDLPPEDPP